MAPVRAPLPAPALLNLVSTRKVPPAGMEAAEGNIHKLVGLLPAERLQPCSTQRSSGGKVWHRVLSSERLHESGIIQVTKTHCTMRTKPPVLLEAQYAALTCMLQHDHVQLKLSTPFCALSRERA